MKKNNQIKENKLTKLTEHQFHSVWTSAVGMDGYNKDLFRNLLQEMKSQNLILPNSCELVNIDKDIENLTQVIKVKASNISTNTDKNRCVKGAYVDCMVMLDKLQKKHFQPMEDREHDQQYPTSFQSPINR